MCFSFECQFQSATEYVGMTYKSQIIEKNFISHSGSPIPIVGGIFNLKCRRRWNEVERGRVQYTFSTNDVERAKRKEEKSRLFSCRGGGANGRILHPWKKMAFFRPIKSSPKNQLVIILSFSFFCKLFWEGGKNGVGLKKKEWLGKYPTPYFLGPIINNILTFLFVIQSTPFPTPFFDGFLIYSALSFPREVK